MVRITYLDPGEDAPRVEWQGVKFLAHQAVEVDEAAKAELVASARTHPHFTVEEDAPAENDPAKADPQAPVPEPGYSPARPTPPPKRR